MSSLVRHPLPYSSDTSYWLSVLQGAPHRVYLDSSRPQGDRGRFDIISADPIYILSSNSYSYEDNKDFTLGLSREVNRRIAAFESCSELPFCGGAVGCISYEAGEALTLGRPPQWQPHYFVGIYDWAIIVDHTRQSADLVIQPGCKSSYPEIVIRSAALSCADTDAFKLTSEISSSLGNTAYRKAFERLQDYIRAGDCYQVNLTREFLATFEGSPLAAYLRLRQVAAAPYSSYMEFEDKQLLCFSPERFLSVNDGVVRTEPIKGTAARGVTPAADRELARGLLESTKNRAENVMIVDLLRNDLGRCCVTGSVCADPLLELQSFPTVHHLVSTVTGRLNEGISAFEALLACFPGGSITGAPKRRAMEIIAELEPHRRGAYCGSVFYLSANGRMDSNIVIRSFVCEGNEIRGWAGGGIVADSVCEDEFQETEEKIGKLLQVLRDC
jgi:para-aminobenzoate synthetase component I